MFNKTFKDPEGNVFEAFVQLDKNNQICDCSRYGNALSILRGRPISLVNPFDVITDEYFTSNGKTYYNNEGIIIGKEK